MDNNKIRILCVVVLYGMRLKESPSYGAVCGQTARCGAEVEFYIHDNSPDADAEAAADAEIVYRHCPGNCGLSAAYNAAARYAEQEGFGWLLLLDQDTQIPDGFLHAYVDAIGENPEALRVFAPRMAHPNGRPLSPIRKWRWNLWPKVSEGAVPMKRYLLINSCLCVETRAFLECGGYDERVWLDFSDLQFVQRLQRAGTRRFGLLPCRCVQNFSGNEPDAAKLKRRYEIYIACARNCTNYGWSDGLFRLYCVLSHTAALTLKVRSCFFLRIFVARYVLHGK